MNNSEKGGLRVVVFGATGTAGSGVLRAALSAPEVASVVAVTRRPVGVVHPKLREVIWASYSDLQPIESEVVGIDACLYCLGISVARLSEPEYRTITFDYALEAARAMKAASPEHTFHFLSGSGTNVNGRLMWARVKGETEEALKRMGLAGILCWRPAMIIGDRVPGGLPWLYRVAARAATVLRYIPALSIPSEMIGEAMIEAQLEGIREGTFTNREMRAIAERYRLRHS